MADSLHEYDLGDMVGSGSSAQVYWAHRVSNGELVAIKVLDKMQHALIRRQSQSMSKATGIQEIEVQQKLNHPNVLQILDVFEDARNAFLVLEPCLGGSLQSLLSRNDDNHRVPLDERRAQHYIRQLVAGIAYIHGQNVLHRDLKLSNILLTSDDVVKIADFGLATDLVTNQSPSTICGTPNFIAPEVLLGKAYTFSADLWSLGCMTYSLLVGTPPFQGQTVAQTLQNVGSADFRVAIPAALSPVAVDFLQCLLCGEPSKRTPCSVLIEHPWLHNSTSPVHHFSSRPSMLLGDDHASYSCKKAAKMEGHDDASSPRPSVSSSIIGVPLAQPSRNLRRQSIRRRRHRRERAPPLTKGISVLSSSSSSNGSASSSGDDDDADIAQLQTVLDKMALRRTSSINQHDLPAEVTDAPATRTTTTASSGVPVVASPVMTFTVEYHSILGRQRSPVSEFTCSRTSFGLELHGPDGTEPHIEYHLADGRIRGSAGTCFDVDFSSLPLADVSAAPVSTWIRLAQWCVAQFPVRDARIAVPDDTLEAMQRSEQLEASLRHHATPSKPTTQSTTSDAAAVVAVELAGVGVAESLEDGTLCLYFMDGAVLQVDDCASTVSYLPVGASTFDVFPLQSRSSDVTKTCDMPHQVSTRLKYVSLFIQEMKRKTQQQQRDYSCSSGP